MHARWRMRVQMEKNRHFNIRKHFIYDMTTTKSEDSNGNTGTAFKNPSLMRSII